jgi:hypothetical protein
VLSGRGLCDGLMTRPEDSYRLWLVVVCDLETSKEEAKSPLKGREYKPTMGCDAERKKIINPKLIYNLKVRHPRCVRYNKMGQVVLRHHVSAFALGHDSTYHLTRSR